MNAKLRLVLDLPVPESLIYCRGMFVGVQNQCYQFIVIDNFLVLVRMVAKFKHVHASFFFANIGQITAKQNLIQNFC
jgi:hypothetical protein